MSGQLEQAENNMDLQQNNTCEDDDLTRIFSVSKEKLELLVLRTIERVIGPIMEDLVRKVVKEQINMVQENLMNVIQSNLSRQENTPEPRRLRLIFLENVRCPVLTSSKIKGVGGVSINLALVDSLTGEVVKTGPEAAMKVEILVLKGDQGGHNGKLDDFNNRIVSEMKGKKSVLQGTTSLNLKEGISSIDDLSFTQNSRWMKNSELCLGARAVNTFQDITVEPANTESFVLKDKRIRAYEKKEMPSLLDKVWRLKHICKGGPRKKRLNIKKIYTVKDLLVLHFLDPDELQKILKVGSKIWEEIIENARTCKIDDAVYIYNSPNLRQNSGVVFNVVGELKGILKESQYFHINTLSDDEQKDAQKLVRCAFEHWEEVSTYKDENSLMEHFLLPLDTIVMESPGQFNNLDPLLLNMCEEPGESSQIRSPEHRCSSPIYSDDDWFSHFAEDELVHFMNVNKQPERVGFVLEPKQAWIIVCLSKWFVIRKRIGSLERNRAKKLKISNMCSEESSAHSYMVV